MVTDRKKKHGLSTILTVSVILVFGSFPLLGKTSDDTRLSRMDTEKTVFMKYRPLDLLISVNNPLHCYGIATGTTPSSKNAQNKTAQKNSNSQKKTSKDTKLKKQGNSTSRKPVNKKD